MDPPTAYIFPSAYDEVVVTKGPQTVTEGSGLVAGAVRFVRKEPEFDTQNTYLNGSVTLGGNKRRDAYFDAMAGGKYGYLRVCHTMRRGITKMAMAIEFIPLLSVVIKCYSLVSHRQKTPY